MNHRRRADPNGQIKILHFGMYEPWGPRRVEDGVEVGGHAICFFKITGGGTVHYYMLQVERTIALTLNGDSTIVEYVLKPENFRQATVLDSIRIAP